VFQVLKTQNFDLFFDVEEISTGRFTEVFSIRLVFEIILLSSGRGRSTFYVAPPVGPGKRYNELLHRVAQERRSSVTFGRALAAAAQDKGCCRTLRGSRASFQERKLEESN
jgi:hypothetical protein